VADRELGALAQEHGDPVAPGNAARGKGVREPRARGQQLAEGPVLHAAVGILDDHGKRVGLMALAHRAADVEALGMFQRNRRIASS
jgi:hypothetical protein